MSFTLSFLISLATFQPFKRQINKLAKHTPTIRRQFADELLECVWLSCGIGAQRVKVDLWSLLAAFFRADTYVLRLYCV